MDELDLTLDGPALTAALVDIPSVSGDETRICAAVESALRVQPHLSVRRHGNVIVAHTELGRAHRVLFAGHVDTVPIADNLPSTVDGGRLYGCGTSDMKAGDAVMLRLAATIREPTHDLTFVFYDNEEVEATRNGLGLLAQAHSDWLAADLAILMEPTSGLVEGGCQGTMRATVTLPGRRAHSARSWLGHNAIHRAAPALQRLADYQARSVDIEGCVYREGLSAVGISGGIAGNVVPDECVITVNFRFAPDRSEEQAGTHVREVFDGFDVTITDSAPGALPGLSAPAAADFVASVGQQPAAKYGWTDVSRFAALGIPALNYGPGDPNLAHTREEHVVIDRIRDAERLLGAYLTS